MPAFNPMAHTAAPPRERCNACPPCLRAHAAARHSPKSNSCKARSDMRQPRLNLVLPTSVLGQSMQVRW